MKRTTTTGPVTFKGARTKTKDLANSIRGLEIAVKDKRHRAQEALHQMSEERLGRLMHEMRWRAQNGDLEANAFLKRKR